MTELPHFDADGHVHMVDVGKKPITFRKAIASALVTMQAATLSRILDRSIAKGDVLEVARVAGVMSTKRTADLIPLCHPIQLDAVEIQIHPVSETQLKVQASVSAEAKTGVEMEAMTAVSVAGLTIYDMCKSVDRSMSIDQIQLEEKSGGKSGHFVRNRP